MERSSPRRLRPRHLFGVLVAILLAGCGTGSGGAAPDTSARLVLDGPWSGIDAGIASAVARGYDQAEGVALHVHPGPLSPRALTDGRADFQVLDLNELAGHRDLVAVMAIAQEPLLAFATRAHRLRTAWARPLSRVLRHPLRRWDLTPGTGSHIESAGVPAYPELVLATARQTLTDSPDVVRATVDAIARGYRFTLTDPQSSAGDLPDGHLAGQVGRLNAAFVGAAGVPGVLDTAQIARWSAWARAHGLPSAVGVEPTYARAAASAGQG